MVALTSPTIPSVSLGETSENTLPKQDQMQHSMSQGSAVQNVQSPGPPKTNRFCKQSRWQTDNTRPQKSLTAFPGLQTVQGFEPFGRVPLAESLLTPWGRRKKWFFAAITAIAKDR